MAQQDEIQAAIKIWRDGLVGLTRQSALIKFRASKTSSLLVDTPTPDEVLSLLQTGKSQAFQGDVETTDVDIPKKPSPGVFFHSPRPDNEVGTVLRSLMRRAAAEYLDRGLSVLYMAFGMLDWKDIDGSEMVSPLLLVPLQLIPEGPKGTPRVTEGEDEPVINPALVLRLKEFGIELPTADEIEGGSVSDTLAAIGSALESVKSFTDWAMRETIYVSLFSFAKEAMFKDLLDNEAKILEHPIVRALATSDSTQQSSEFNFDPLDPVNIDKSAPPENTPLVLDADSSQRVAIAAALAGKTFVMDGPPGTGKSQTIANMIGALLHAGKTVLFVSEKMAALDVVRNRLNAAGLGSYLLELHSHKASRKEVATELLKTLDNIASPPKEMPTLTRQTIKERRQQLNEYAAAMNEKRSPLNMTLHHVLGLYSELSTAPVAPVPENAILDLSEAAYFNIRETLPRLLRAWRPAAQGKSFLWREVLDEKPMEVRLYQAETALEELRDLVRLNPDMVDAFGLAKPSDTPKLASLIEHQHSYRPNCILEQWLTAESTHSLETARVNLGQQIAALQTAEETVFQTAGIHWSFLPDPATVSKIPSTVSATPFPVNLRNIKLSELRSTADQFETDALMLENQVESLSSFATTLGLPCVTLFTDVERLSKLVNLRSMNIRFERGWFTPSGLAEARAASCTLREQVIALSDAEAKATETFSSEALTAPLAELKDRFTNLHKGLRKLSGKYRADKTTIAGLLTNATDVKNGIGRLSEAIEWDEAYKALESSAAVHSKLLGSYWADRETNFEEISIVHSNVEEVLALTDNIVPTKLITFLIESDSNEIYQRMLESASIDLDHWKERLRPSPALTARPELLLKTVENAIQWLRGHIRPMQETIEYIQSVSMVTGSDHSWKEVDELLVFASKAKQASDELHSAAPFYEARFGSHFKFLDSDLDSLDAAISWGSQLRSIVGSPLNLQQVEALSASNVVENLSQAYEKWSLSSSKIVEGFAPSRHNELTTDLDDYSDAFVLINDLRADTVGQQEWFEYQRSYDDLAKQGLNTAVDFCIGQRMAEYEVPRVVTRALLRGWSDAVIQQDERLRPLLATEREALVEEYRILDRDLIKTATSDIINAANRRRPVNTVIGESGVIRREGGKQKRHRPVRDLISMTRNVTSSIKPIFMMSPLAVSQYIPSDMEFDVVIFDEASQVRPGDAINCVYRGKSLILAGDDKQLPPTSFFEHNTDDEEGEETDVKDFQSVLELSKAAGAFNNLGLRWHYRSRHEDLIAFSNYKFYDGKLVTFPSAHVNGDDVGVDLFLVDGIYRRGGGAINPIEAAETANRVIAHFSDRPDLTLGVVTFSVAQAEAVQNALDEARTYRRDLDRFFDTADRLDGFFIRPLEQVQGDERDVIIFSVGYGPDEAGKISVNFGALNKDKGWRRLNVGITRARQRVEVVASMTAGKIPPSSNENVEYFRAYLQYAEKGQQTLAIPYSSTGLDPESPFEESVLAAIQDWGYTVEPQVGAAGFRIDLGVRHPAYPGMFAIGIECDGYQYHSAPAARDRDRLRDQILTGLGWRLHRIWGTAWYRDRKTEEIRLRAAIEAAIEAPIEGRTKKFKPIEHPVVKMEQADPAAKPKWATSYVTAPKTQLPRWADPGESANYLHMVDAIQVLVEYEGPIHIDVAHARLRDWWNIGRIGSNIRNNIDRAIQKTSVIRDGDFLLLSEHVTTQVRTPTDEVSRKAEHVHLQELGTAAIMIIRDVGAPSHSEVVQGVARTFGWAKTGTMVERRINEAIERIIADGRVSNSDETLTMTH